MSDLRYIVWTNKKKLEGIILDDLNDALYVCGGEYDGGFISSLAMEFRDDAEANGSEEELLMETFLLKNLKANT